MKKFLIRLCNAVLIIAALLGYNNIAKAHEAEDAAAKAEADAINAEVAAAWAALAAEEEASKGDYIDGSYQGTAAGYGGDITVEVTVENGWITDVAIVSAKDEDGAYLIVAQMIIDTIISEQSADVDTITGATFSSEGIRSATEKALANAQ